MTQTAQGLFEDGGLQLLKCEITTDITRHNSITQSLSSSGQAAY